jgi:4-hydroxyacetophenone monooxygenase
MATVPSSGLEVPADHGGSDTKLVPGYDVDENFIREAIQDASANTLRLALLQVTGDKELESMPVSKKEIRYGWLYDYVLSESDEKKVKEKAIDYLLKGPREAPPPPPKEDVHRLIDIFSDEPLTNAPEDFFDYEEGYEELALEDYPRDVKWTKQPSAETLEGWKVLIIGAGISGIAAGILLKRLGIPFEILERQGGVGGTWLLNTYPEARVDTLSFLFQYKFVKNYKWTEHFASRAETQKYLSFVANEHGILDNCRFNREVLAANWNESSAKWRVKVKHNDGREELLVANAVISASGLFSTPNLPDIPGIDSFKKPIFHTAQWNHGVNYHGKKVAVIGTGSSGTQVSPGLAPHVQKLAVYQRTPNWIVKIDGYRKSVSSHMRWMCDNMPYYWNWFCFAAFFRSMHIAELQYYDKEWQAQGGGVNRRNDGIRRALTEFMEEKFADRPDLLEKVKPRHAPLVRRLVVDNGFYDAIQRPNVELVTENIDRITEKGILSADGKEREFDLIVLAGGFKVSQYLWPVQYIGREGMTLEKAWAKDGARSYLGEVMPYYPNLFTMYGPNHQPRGGSLYSAGESWARYAVASIVGMIERGAKSMEVKKDVFDRYQEKLDQANKRIIWEMADSGYYVNKHGRQAVNMPWTTAEYHRLIRRPNFEDFDLK